jgi:hypothetical protein
MYNPQNIVGDFFEEKVMQLFDLIRTDRKRLGNVPDLMSKDCSFYVEVKASAYNNGGVINKTQLFRFDKEIDIRRFYAFVYHSISRDMQKDYTSKKELRKALDLKSLYLFPFSIAKAHYKNSKPRTHPKHDDFVQLKESLAQKMFAKEAEAWQHLGLDDGEYKTIQLHKKIHIVTKQGYLEQQILDSFHSGFI